MVVDEHVLEPLAAAAGRLARRLGARVGAGERQRRVRERPELEVVGGVGALVERGEHVLERLRRVDPAQPEATARSAASRPPRRRARRARPAPPAGGRRPSSSRSLPSPSTSSIASTCADRFGSRAPGAVRAGGQRAGHRLDVDVAEVRQRQAAQVQLAAEPVQRHAGLHPHERAVGVEHARHPVEREQRAGGQHGLRERVPGPRHAHRPGGARRARRPAPRAIAGRSIAAGSQRWVRDQLTHAATRGP